MTKDEGTGNRERGTGNGEQGAAGSEQRAASVPSSPFPVPSFQFPMPDNWPRGSGYSHAVVAEGRQIFVAGQIGWDPVTLEIVPGGMAAQARRAFENIVAVLAAAGARPEHIVRFTWFITDRGAYVRDRDAIGAAYRAVIGRHFPAMSVIVVSGLIEPGAEIEIEATAVVPPASGPTNSTGA